MSSAVQAAERGRSRLFSRRAAARLRHAGLRGAAIVYLGAMVALPVAAVIDKGFGGGLGALRSALAAPSAWHAITLTLETATIATAFNMVFGTALAWVLVRYQFPGRRFLSVVCDLPLAIPTLVTGVMLVAIYGPSSPVGRGLENAGIQVIYAPLGVLIALMVVTLPFVVRAVQPVLLEIDPAEEEAAATLGAGGWTSFRKIVLPAIRPAIVAGALLTFARCLGEFGAIVIVSGNTGRTITAPVFIAQLISQFRYEDAAAIATLLFTISFVLVMVTVRLQRRPEAAQEEEDA
jgi:sulfate transport system permease protein